MKHRSFGAPPDHREVPVEILSRYREALVEEMDSFLGGPPSPILTMCRYHLGLADVDGTPRQAAAGKMLRPALCLAMCEALGSNPRQCLPVAVSLEMLHRTSLVFDDIQDHSPQRNHRPTVWEVWGMDQAINAGLALSSYSRLALLGMVEQSVPSSIVTEVYRLLERTVIDLCQGQYLDLHLQQVWWANHIPTVDEYLAMAELKTGALLGTVCEVGAIVAGATDKRDTARRLGENLGVAFQLQDDILGVWGDPQRMGKTTNDIADRKTTLPIILAIMRDPGPIMRLYGTPEMNDRTVGEVLDLLDTFHIRSSVDQLLFSWIERVLEPLKALGLSPKWQRTWLEMIALLFNRTT